MSNDKFNDEALKKGDFVSYIPERPYEETHIVGTVMGLKPLGKICKHICDSCDLYYDKLHNAGLKNSPDTPRCDRAVFDLYEGLTAEDMGSEKDLEDFMTSSDPVVWAYNEFGWEARFYQEEVLSCTAYKKVLRQGRRCVVTDTPVLMDNGNWSPIQKVSPGDSVISISEGNARPVSNRILNKFDNGIQQVFRVRLTNGLSVDCTSNHPFLKLCNPKGTEKNQYKEWKTIDSGLSCGDKVFVLDNYCYKSEVDKIHDPDLAGLIGYLITDGYLPSKGNTPKLTNKNRKILDDARSLAQRRFNLICTEKKKGEAYDLFFTDGNHATSNPLVDLLDSEGILGLKSKRKRLPDIVHKMNLASVGKLFNAMWSGGGTLYVKDRLPKAPSIEACLVSQSCELLDSCRLILLKHGIVGRIDKEDRTVYPPHSKSPIKSILYRLRISDTESVSRFLDLVGPVVGKEEKFYEMREAISQKHRRRNPGNGFIRPVTIKSIELIGNRQTWDIEVENDHNFIANGIVNHNSGKTSGIVVDILHKCVHNKGYKVMVISPFMSQIEVIFNMIKDFLNSSVHLKNSVARSVRNPHLIEFYNGSAVRGFAVKPGDPNAIDKVRGQEADYIYMDEADFLDPNHIQVITPIVIRPNIYVTATSTPKGTKTHFFNWAMDKNLGFKEFWFISAENPDWTEETGEFIGRDNTQAVYSREYDAEFTISEAGVFRKDLVDAAIRRYKLEDCGPDPRYATIMGIDWNKGVGGHMVMVSYDGEGHFKLVGKWIINPDEYKQTTAVDAVIKINEKWNPQFIFVDAGYGDVQVEMLERYGTAYPGTGLRNKIIPINMSSNIEIRNPADNTKEKKHAKTFMVMNATKQLENGALLLPRAEDTSVRVNKDNPSEAVKIGLVQQMREFEIKQISQNGRPIYTQGADHTLTAYMLALLGFTLKYSVFGKASSRVDIRQAGGIQGLVRTSSEDPEDKYFNVDRSIDTEEPGRQVFQDPETPGRINQVPIRLSKRSQKALRSQYKRSSGRRELRKKFDTGPGGMRKSF